VTLLRETVTSFEPLAEENELHVVLDLARSQALPAVHCDRDRVLQVLSNLIANAIKVTPGGGTITLAAEPRQHEVVLVVSDTGPGIAPDQLEHIFDRYWRGGRVGYKGTGLGLGIARGIVEAHGGRIWVESALGQGATFRFTLPIEAEAERAR
jgi:signal transduction histidine kinase